MKLILEYPFHILIKRHGGSNLDETIDDELKGTVVDVISKSGFAFNLSDNLYNLWHEDKYSSKYQLTLKIESDAFVVNKLISALKKIDFAEYLMIYSYLENESDKEIIYKNWSVYEDELRKLKSSERKKIIRKIKRLNRDEAKEYLDKELLVSFAKFRSGRKRLEI